MTVTPELLAEVHRGRRQSIEALLEMHYPMVHRLAHALLGRADAARAVVDFVFSRALPNSDKWADESAPFRWFSHHTVLTARRVEDLPPDPKKDLLVLASDSSDPAYVAFIRALRTLPLQQKEAIILHHGENLDARQSAVAMDCSVEAAVNHLEAGRNALQTIAGNAWDNYIAAMGRAYNALTPADAVARPVIGKHLSVHLRPRRIRRIIWGAIAAIVIAMGVVAYFRYA